jgi:transposase
LTPTMPKKKYIVTLMREERQQLEQLSRTGKASAYQITRARILLKADTDQAEGSWTDAEISAALDVSVATIERLREQFIDEGLKCLQRKTRVYQSLLDGEQEAKLVALACSEAPAGRSRWTLRLLSERVVELGYVEQISHETVRQTLKKTHSSLGAKTAG